VARKILVGLIVFVCCFIFILFNGLVAGVDFYDTVAYILIFSLPILLVYAPFCSVIADTYSKRKVEGSQYKTKKISLIIHIISGALFPFLLIMITKPNDLLPFIFDVFGIVAAVVSGLFGFLFWLCDQLLLEHLNKKLNNI
jgi:hypothetical protein